jgi:adenosylmethionine-8-amino-7-oxononanoate aminotransferase
MNANATSTRFWHPFADMSQVADHELLVQRGEGVWIWDDAGRRYLDATASLWYANVGHGRPEIRAAVAAQMEQIEAYSTFGDFVTRPAKELTERLAELAPIPDARVFLGSGGGDGIETAAKLARQYWWLTGRVGKTHLLTRTGGYHGTHGFGTSLGGIEANTAGFGPLVDDVSVVAFDSLEALDQRIREVGPGRIAAFFAEPVIGAGGVLPPPDGYIEGAAALCREHEILFVADSVICGFGRLGTWFGIERWDVTPDMIVFAKGVTSGYLPLGGVIISGELAEPFWETEGRAFRHGVTYAGHATCCAAALANIELLEREHLIERGRELEAVLADALKPLADHDQVAEVRAGLGLLAAVELTPDLVQNGAVAQVAAAARQAGVIVRGLARGVAVSPPLIVGVDEIALIGEALEQAVTSVG